jgi:hypothetical protein
MANGWAIHRLAISSRSAEPADGFRQTKFTLIRLRSVGLGWYQWDGVPVLGNDYQALAAGLSILRQALPQVPPVPLVPPVPPASE